MSTPPNATRFGAPVKNNVRAICCFQPVTKSSNFSVSKSPSSVTRCASMGPAAETMTAPSRIALAASMTHTPEAITSWPGRLGKRRANSQQMACPNQKTGQRVRRRHRAAPSIRAQLVPPKPATSTAATPMSNNSTAKTRNTSANFLDHHRGGNIFDKCRNRRFNSGPISLLWLYCLLQGV